MEEAEVKWLVDRVEALAAELLKRGLSGYEAYAVAAVLVGQEMRERNGGGSSSGPADHTA